MIVRVRTPTSLATVTPGTPDLVSVALAFVQTTTTTDGRTDRDTLVLERVTRSEAWTLNGDEITFAVLAKPPRP